jgi:ribose transport system substrate-binding protein
MGKILNSKGKIVVVKYAPGSASTMKREDGFINTIEKEFPGIEIVDTKYGMDTVETSLQAAEDLLTKNAELDGLFACNESTSVGALRALQSQGRAGKMKMVGFDAGGLLIEGVKTGVVDSLVVQNPYKMGYTGVKALIDTLDGKKVDRRVDTGVVLVTKENLETEEIRELLKGMYQ